MRRRIKRRTTRKKSSRKPRKKWGKIGAPHSAKRKKWMRHLARMRR